MYNKCTVRVSVSVVFLEICVKNMSILLLNVLKVYLLQNVNWLMFVTNNNSRCFKSISILLFIMHKNNILLSILHNEIGAL